MQMTVDVKEAALCVKGETRALVSNTVISLSLSLLNLKQRKKTICHLQCSSGAKIQLELWKLTRSNPECLRDLNAP